jgi:hypothetical protein
MPRASRMILPVFVITLCIATAVRAQDAKVVRELSPEAIAKSLKDLKIEFNQTASPKGEEHCFEFTRGNYRIRLTQFSPQELMLDCVFRGIPIDRVNEWNALARLTRASLHDDPSGKVTLLAYGLDLAGGVTEATIQQYLTRFEDELKKYDRFVSDDAVLAAVTDDKLENILKTQGISFKKSVNANGIPMFDFELNGQKLRMYNFGGKDLMMDVHYRKISLEHANRYNLNRKFVRVVNYKGKDMEYTALEINLDCEAGATEGMIRNWILSFGEDARHFAEYAKKLQQTAETK